jgi:phenylalanyl-tRNA synthetase beta chain
MAEMRTSLWPGLLQAVRYNVNRQKSRLRFFEHGLRFQSLDDGSIQQDVMLAGVVSGSRLPETWTGKSDPVDFYDLKNDIQTILQLTGKQEEYKFEKCEHPALHPGQSAAIQYAGRTVGWLGRVHPLLARACDLAPDTCLFELEYEAVKTGQLAEFRPISRFPSIRRDLAVVVDAGLQVDVLKAAVREIAGDFLQEMVVFDVYQGKGIESGRKSIAFGLILQDKSRTLTEQDIEAVVSSVTDRLARKFGATLRD